MLTRLAWLAGILEGEGTFRVSGYSPTITLRMTDKDIVRRVSLIFENKVRSFPPDKRGNKPYYITSAYGSRAASLMMTLFPFFGERRQDDIKTYLSIWKSSSRRPYKCKRTL
jgi:hypothetical protein